MGALMPSANRDTPRPALSSETSPIARRAEALRSRLAELAREEAQVARQVMAPRSPTLESESHAALLSQLAGVAAKKSLLLIHLVDWIESQWKLASQTSTEHADKLELQAASIRNICLILKNLDDPYGFGAAVDDGIASETDEFLREA